MGDIEQNPTTASRREGEGELQRLQVERGRIWRSYREPSRWEEHRILRRRRPCEVRPRHPRTYCGVGADGNLPMKQQLDEIRTLAIKLFEADAVAKCAYDQLKGHK